MKNKKRKQPDPDELLSEWYGPEWGAATTNK